jgi:hypothetical protein
LKKVPLDKGLKTPSGNVNNLKKKNSSLKRYLSITNDNK